MYSNFLNSLTVLSSKYPISVPGPPDPTGSPDVTQPPPELDAKSAPAPSNKTPFAFWGLLTHPPTALSPCGLKEVELYKGRCGQIVEGEEGSTSLPPERRFCSPATHPFSNKPALLILLLTPLPTSQSSPKGLRLLCTTTEYIGVLDGITYPFWLPFLEQNCPLRL